MSITTTQLTRMAGLSARRRRAAVHPVQINHPALTLEFVTTAEFAVRQSMKVGFTLLALAGILGLAGYLIFATGLLAMLTIEVVGLVILPEITSSAPGYAGDVLAVATGGKAAGDIGLMKTLSLLSGAGYMAGGLVFGIALVRANVLARWASILLAVAAPLSIAALLLPWVNQRLFAVPTGVALIALGYSLWRQQRTHVTVTSESSRPAEPAVAR